LLRAERCFPEVCPHRFQPWESRAGRGFQATVATASTRTTKPKNEKEKNQRKRKYRVFKTREFKNAPHPARFRRNLAAAVMKIFNTAQKSENEFVEGTLRQRSKKCPERKLRRSQEANQGNRQGLVTARGVQLRDVQHSHLRG
jgi:hypothetical protein